MQPCKGLHASFTCGRTRQHSHTLLSPAASSPRQPAHAPTANRQKAAVHRPCRQMTCRSGATEAAPSGPPKLSETELRPVKGPDGSVSAFPDLPAIYGVYNEAKELQYIGLSRKVSATIAGYLKDLPDLTHSVKLVAGNASRDQLVGLWQEWMQQAVNETGNIPPGNAKGNTTWLQKKKAKAEIRLTPGKGIQDLTCSVQDLVDQVVKTNKVVAFVKGTRREPQCGFSYQVLSTLNELGADYEVLNVLDETYNPGLREAIKEYSQWPTIPQLYVNGEFLGGADIIDEMRQSGELKQALSL